MNTKTKSTGKSWVEAAASSNDSNDEILKWDKKINFFEFPDNTSVQGRLIGGIFTVARHWVPILGRFKPDGRPQVFPAWCTKCNPETGNNENELVCPLHDDFGHNAQKYYATNFIVRDFQEDPRKKRENPVVPILLPERDVKVYISEIVKKIKGDPADPALGCDISIKYNPSAKGKDPRWIVTRDDRTVLSEEELEYNLVDFSIMIPDYSQKAVNAVHSRTLKENLARVKYYVTKLPSGKGLGRFKGNVDGEPYTNFEEIRDIADLKKGKAIMDALEAASGASEDSGMPAPSRPTVKAGAAAKPASKQSMALDDDDPAPVGQGGDSDVPFDQDGSQNNTQNTSVEKTVVQAQKAQTVAVKTLEMPIPDIMDGIEEGENVVSGPLMHREWLTQNRAKWNTAANVPDCFYGLKPENKGFIGKKQCMSCPVKQKCIDAQTPDSL